MHQYRRSKGEKDSKQKKQGQRREIQSKPLFPEVELLLLPNTFLQLQNVSGGGVVTFAKHISAAPK